jgi:hypothetical protein
MSATRVGTSSRRAILTLDSSKMQPPWIVYATNKAWRRPLLRQVKRLADREVWLLGEIRLAIQREKPFFW